MVLKSVKTGNIVVQNSKEGFLQKARIKLGSKGQACLHRLTLHTPLE